MTIYSTDTNPLLKLLEEVENEPVMEPTATGSTPSSVAPKVPAGVKSKVSPGVKPKPAPKPIAPTGPSPEQMALEKSIQAFIDYVRTLTPFAEQGTNYLYVIDKSITEESLPFPNIPEVAMFKTYFQSGFSTPLIPPSKLSSRNHKMMITYLLKLNGIISQRSTHPMPVELLTEKIPESESFIDKLFKAFFGSNVKKELTEKAKTELSVNQTKPIINQELQAIQAKIDAGVLPFKKHLDIDDNGYMYEIKDIQNEFCKNHKELREFVITNVKDENRPFKPSFTNTELFYDIKNLFMFLQLEDDKHRNNLWLQNKLKLSENTLDILIKEVFPNAEKTPYEIIKDVKDLAKVQDIHEADPSHTKREIIENTFTKAYWNFAKFTGMDVEKDMQRKFVIFNGYSFLNNFPFKSHVDSYVHKDISATEKAVVESMAKILNKKPEEIFYDKQSKDEFLKRLDGLFIKLGDMKEYNVFDHIGNIYFFKGGIKIDFTGEGHNVDRVKFLRLISAIRHLVYIRKEIYQLEISTDEIKKIAGRDSTIVDAVNTRANSAIDIREFFKLMGRPVPLYGERYRHYLIKHLPKKFFGAVKNFFNSWDKNQFETFIKR